MADDQPKDKAKQSPLPQSPLPWRDDGSLRDANGSLIALRVGARNRAYIAHVANQHAALVALRNAVESFLEKRWLDPLGHRDVLQGLIAATHEAERSE